jgi:hypothetical protein
MHHHNPRLSKFKNPNLTTMSTASAELFGLVAPGAAMEPALHLRNTRPKSPLSPICAIAPPHGLPKN